MTAYSNTYQEITSGISGEDIAKDRSRSLHNLYSMK